MRHLKLFCALYFVLISTGCGLKTVDPLPNETIKGYVEFYGESNMTSKDSKWAVDPLVIIYQLQEGEKIKRGGIVINARLRLRIACMPGLNTFSADMGDAQEKIQVEILRDKIIPIRIIGTPGAYSEEVGYLGGYHITRIQSFSISHYIEKAVPFKK